MSLYCEAIAACTFTFTYQNPSRYYFVYPFKSISSQTHRISKHITVGKYSRFILDFGCH